MAVNSYQIQFTMLVKECIFTDTLIAFISVLCGVLACKLVYNITKFITAMYFKSYSNLSKIQQIEWNNRAISTVHAIFITVISLYLVLWSDLYSDHRMAGNITSRSSSLSTYVLGVSVGYFITDLGMILWLYPLLGGKEYVVHHLASITAVVYAMLTREGQLYTYMVLMSEMTTPAINLRWYLDALGMKKSKTYLINGTVIFFVWLVARILLFAYLFYHVYLHYDEVKHMHSFGLLLVFGVPTVLSVMNLMWFRRITNGLKKLLVKRQ